MVISRTCSPSGAMPVQMRFLWMEIESTVMQHPYPQASALQKLTTNGRPYKR
jgi:hypothetical protein